MPDVLYLHGFCSSAKSAKGVFLADRFAELGGQVALPELDEGDFEHTTLTRQLGLVGRIVRELRPSLVIGSSLGGYLAALHAAREPGTVPALVLMAPAFDFGNRLAAALGPEEDEWRRAGRRAFFHYRLKRETPLAHAFLQDARRYEPFPEVAVRTRILHGRWDDSVPLELSVEFARDKPHVELERYDTNHQMLDVTDRIWSSIKEFHERVQSLRT